MNEPVARADIRRSGWGGLSAGTVWRTALRVAARELELYDTGNVDGADEVFAPDLIDHNPAADAASGIDGMRASIAAVRDGFTDTQHRILFQQELPGGWVVLHWRMTGIHTGDAFTQQISSGAQSV